MSPSDPTENAAWTTIKRGKRQRAGALTGARNKVAVLYATGSACHRERRRDKHPGLAISALLTAASLSVRQEGELLKLLKFVH